MNLPTKTAWAGPLIYKTVQEIDHKATGEAMRVLRKSHRISLREIARRMKVSAPFLSDLERGNRNWDASRVLSFMQEVTGAQIARITAAQAKAHTTDFHIGIQPAARVARSRRDADHKS